MGGIVILEDGTVHQLGQGFNLASIGAMKGAMQELLKQFDEAERKELRRRLDELEGVISGSSD